MIQIAMVTSINDHFISKIEQAMSSYTLTNIFATVTNFFSSNLLIQVIRNSDACEDI